MHTAATGLVALMRTARFVRQTAEPVLDIAVTAPAMGMRPAVLARLIVANAQRPVVTVPAMALRPARAAHQTVEPAWHHCQIILMIRIWMDGIAQHKAEENA